MRSGTGVFSAGATSYAAVTPTAAMPGAPWTLGQDFTAGVNVQGQQILGGPFNGSNQWTSATYDLYGNQTSGAATSITAITGYDGENRPSSVKQPDIAVTSSYLYDGQQRRVAKIVCTSGTDPCVSGAVDAKVTIFVYDAAGELVAEYGQQRLSGGKANPILGTLYPFADALGSTRLVTDSAGTNVRCIDYFPFGEEIGTNYGNRTGCYAGFTGYPSPSGVDLTTTKFTDVERDVETGLDYFGARYFSGAQGRFTGADEPLSYADAGSPQSWNLYSYGYNNPVVYSDSDGHEPCPPSGNINGDPCTYIPPTPPDLSWFTEMFVRSLFSTVQLGMQAQRVTQPLANWLGSRDPNCTMQGMARGGAFGLALGGTIGLAGGPGGFATVPLAGGLGFLGFAAAGGIGGLITCSSGNGGGGDGSSEPTEDFELFNDATGKVHGDLPKHVPEGMTRGQLERAAEALKKSIVVRQQGFQRLGRAGNHGDRLAQEQALLRQILKRLGQ